MGSVYPNGGQPNVSLLQQIKQLVKDKYVSFYLPGTIILIELISLLYLVFICISKTLLTLLILHVLYTGHLSNSELLSLRSFHQKRVMLLLRKIPFSTLPSHLRKKGQLMQPSSMLSWLWLVGTTYQHY